MEERNPNLNLGRGWCEARVNLLPTHITPWLSASVYQAGNAFVVISTSKTPMLHGLDQTATYLSAKLCPACARSTSACIHYQYIVDGNLINRYPRISSTYRKYYLGKRNIIKPIHTPCYKKPLPVTSRSTPLNST